MRRGKNAEKISKSDVTKTIPISPMAHLAHASRKGSTKQNTKLVVTMKKK